MIIMEELICPDCGKKFPNQPPYRIISKYQGDIVKCPFCNSQGNSRFFMPKTDNLTTGIGIPLQIGPNNLTPSQQVLQKLQKTSQNIENKGFFKISDKIDMIIKNYKSYY